MYIFESEQCITENEDMIIMILLILLIVIRYSQRRNSVMAFLFNICMNSISSLFWYKFIVYNLIGILSITGMLCYLLIKNIYIFSIILCILNEFGYNNKVLSTFTDYFLHPVRIEYRYEP